MKTLEDFTSQIREKIPKYQRHATERLYSGQEYSEYNRQDTVEYIEKLYELAGQKRPVVIVANTLKQYKIYFNLLFNVPDFIPKINAAFFLKNGLHNEKGDELFSIINKEVKIDKSTLKNSIEVKTHYNFLASEYSRIFLMWYKFIKDEFEIKTTKAEILDWLYEKVNKANIAKCFFCERVCLVLRMPQKINRNDAHIHDSTPNGAIIYPDQKLYYLNGRRMPDWIFDKYFSNTLELKDFIEEKNEDVKGGIITLIKENEGNEGLVKFLGAKVIDTKVIKHSETYSETLRLLRTTQKFSFARNREGKENCQLAWLEEQCPSTGTTYLIDTWPDFTDALEAAKFHRPSAIPEKLEFIWKHFAN